MKTKIPHLILASCLCAAQSASAALVFQMDFNDADGNQSLTDRGTTGVTGAFNENGTGTYSTDVASVNGGGYSASFSGTNGDHVNFGDINALDGLSAFTMTAWVKSSDIDGPSGSARIVSKRTSTDGFELYYHSTDNELEFVANGGVANGGGSFTANSWTWIAVTYDGSTANFYTGNGTTVSAGDSAALAKGAFSANSANLLIGNYRNGLRPYSGLIDNVRIYNSVEDAASLTSIMKFNDAVAVPEPSSAALLGLGGFALILRRRK